MIDAASSIWGTLDPFVEPGPVLGRKVANQGFLDALLSVDPFKEYHFFLPDITTRRNLEAYLRQVHPQVLSKISLFPRTALPKQLASRTYYCFHLSDCLTTQGFLAALRNAVSRHIFPITGVTHTLSYARFGLAFAQHIWAGVTQRDCIVATSQAGQEVVRKELSLLSNVIKGKVPQIRVIPLGVWCQEFAGASPKDICDLADKKTIFLVLGRISPYSKMDLVPLLRAFQYLGQQGVDLAKFCLVLAGGTDESSSLPETLSNLATNIGLELKVVQAPGDAEKKILLQQADVIVSLADNPQETFGLILLEAAAAGKPVIVSDYNGYRDLIVQNKTGIRVPTIDSGVQDLVSLMAPLLYDTEYHLWLAQDVAVDVQELARAIRVMQDPAMRNCLGEQARLRACTVYDWPQIIKDYCSLWAELNKAPVSMEEGGVVHPLAMDYASVFQGYTLERLQDSQVLETTALGWAVYKQQDFPIVYTGIEERINLEIMRRILVWARKPISWQELSRRESNESLRSTIMWMLKNNYVHVVKV